MWDIKACKVCLSTGIKLYSLNTGNLRHEFNSISGLKTTKRCGMPNHLCLECCAFVKKFIQFQQKCQRAHYIMEQILGSTKEIKKSHLRNLNRKQLGVLPSLSLVDLTRSHYETIIYQQTKSNSTCQSKTSHCPVIPLMHYTTLTKEDTFEDVMTYETEENNIKIEYAKENIQAQNKGLKSLFETDKSKFEIGSDFIEPDNVNDVEFNDDLFEFGNEADGSTFNEEYAKMVPISVKEAKAAMEVKKLSMSGSHKCDICGHGFKTKENLKVHSRMHDKHLKGNYHCEICNYYYKTKFLLEGHMTEKHMYKYICRLCPEVTFDRLSAKSHFCVRHLYAGKSGSPWKVEKRPAWLGRGTRKKTLKNTRKKKECTRKRNVPITIPKDMFTFEPISPIEQYSIIQNRKTSRNYLEAKYKCEFCFRGFRLMTTYNNHMVKHNSVASGDLQCDMCKLYFRDQRKMYKHMNMYHLSKYSCRSCDFVSTNRSQAVAHYKWHANVTYDCVHCDKKFVKASTRLTHIRLKHPSTYICNLCGHSFVSSAGLTCHKQITHSKEEILERDGVLDTNSSNYCPDCDILFASEQAYATHLGSSSKHVNTNISVQKTQRDSRKRMRKEMGAPTRAVSREVGLVQEKRLRNGTSEVLNTGVTTSNNCEMCGKYLVNDVQARRHYEAEHPGADFLRRYMCEICGHTARQYANLLVHMRTHTNEKPYECPRCDRRFSMLSNRDRHLVVHTGEKRYQCQHCNRRFTQSSAVKLHIQTVHLKIPYAPWDKKNRKRRKELETAGISSDVNLVEAPPIPAMPQQPKLNIDLHGDYVDAYITYGDE